MTMRATEQPLLFPDVQASDAPPSALTLTAAAVFDFAAKSADGKPTRPTFSITAYTGSPMNVQGFLTPIIVDLTGLKANRARIPILFDHDATRVVGQTDSIGIDSSGVRLTGTVTGDDGDSARIVQHAKNGFEWQASIGATIVRQEFLKSGEKAIVNGREVSGPLLIAREARMYETSFVAAGADPQTSVNVAASLPDGPPQGADSMNFDQWVKAKGFDPAALNDAQRTALKAMYDAEQKPTAPPTPTPTPTSPSPATPVQASAVTTSATTAAATLDDLMAGIRREEERKEQITRLTAHAASERPAMIDEYERMGRLAIEARTPVADYELALLRVRASAPNVIIHGPDRRASVKAIEAAVCVGGGLDNIDKHFDQQTLNAASDRFPRGLGLRDLLVMAARDRGYVGHDSTDVRGLLQAAFGGDVRASGFSSLSLPGILSNTANKFLVQGFNAVEDAWRMISSRRNVRDFKTNTSYSLTGGMTYEKVGPGGELKHATVGELTYTNRAETYGRMFAITRQDIINDDLGALTQVPMKLGRGAALKLNDVFWTAFLAGIAANFWHSTNKNVSTGAGSALASAGLKAALAVFRKQVDPDGLPVAIMPKILLVPPELEITADELMTSAMVNTGGSSTTDQVPNRNVWSGKFTPVMSSYLSNTAYTGSSTAAWFLLADPNDMPTIEVAFLNGRDTPIVESADADFNTLGIQMRGYHDFGVALQEHRASVRSAGS